MEFAAAISPNMRGLSTTGVIKSMVSMPTRFSSIFQRAASSPLFHEARSSSFLITGRSFNIWSSSAGPILAAQPLVFARSVSLTVKTPFLFQTKMVDIRCGENYLFAVYINYKSALFRHSGCCSAKFLVILYYSDTFSDCRTNFSVKRE